MYFQEVVTQWHTGVFFDLFSVSALRKINIDSYEARFNRLTSFLLSQNLVFGSPISCYKYPSFARRVVDSAI